MKALKTNETACAKNPWLFLIMLVMLFLIAFAQLSALAQSGRLPPPPSTPTPTPQTVSPTQEATRSFVIDRNGDTYKLVFPTGPDFVVIKGRYRLPEDDFCEQLNKAGEQGYNLVSVIYHWQRVSALNYYLAPVAILKLNEVQHEYAWFETSSNLYFTLPGFEQKYTELSKRGFHLIDYHLTDSYCELGQECGYHDFLLERERGVEKPNQFLLAHWRLQRKPTMAAELTAQIKDKLADGFYPSYVFSKWDILLTKMENRDELSTDDLDVQVLVSALDVKNKVNDLARQGYRLLLVNSGIVVMGRRSNSATPVSYVWLDVKKKDFEKGLQEMQGLGAIYRMTYPNREGTKNELIFELGAGDNGKRREYKVLKFDFQVLKYSKLIGDGGKEVHVDLTPSSKEIMKTINALAKEGFVARDLFTSDKVSVLLERSR